MTLSLTHPPGGSCEASPRSEDCPVQPGVHLRTHGGGGLLPDVLAGKPL